MTGFITEEDIIEKLNTLSDGITALMIQLSAYRRVILEHTQLQEEDLDKLEEEEFDRFKAAAIAYKRNEDKGLS